MSQLMDLIKRRSSTRAYQDRSVPREMIAEVIEAVRHAPSSCHSQPWRFIAVTDPALLKKLTEECLGQPVPNRWVRTAPAILVACAVRKAIPNYLGEPFAGISYYQIDMGIAMEHAVLRAEELGLGTCYIGWFKAGKLKKLLGLPPFWKVVCLMTLGYPAEGSGIPKKRLPLEDILFFNSLAPDVRQ